PHQQKRCAEMAARPNLDPDTGTWKSEVDAALLTLRDCDSLLVVGRLAQFHCANTVDELGLDLVRLRLSEPESFIGRSHSARGDNSPSSCLPSPLFFWDLAVNAGDKLHVDSRFIERPSSTAIKAAPCLGCPTRFRSGRPCQRDRDWRLSAPRRR